MRPASISWERAAEVREAAAGWLRAGVIGRPTYEAVLDAHPDPCLTPSAVWRILTAGMVTAVTLFTLGALGLALGAGSTALSLLLVALGATALVVAEHLDRSPRFARRGAAGTAAFWGGVFVLVGLGILLREHWTASSRALDVVLAASAVVWAVSCWRWGSPLFAGLSAVSLFVLLGRMPLGRALWLLAGAALVGLVARLPDDPAWAPSHRRAAMVLLVVGLGAAYVAINVYSLDGRFIEELATPAPTPSAPPPWLFALAAIGTAVLPLVVLLWGWRSRRTVVLDTGIVLTALSLVTLRHYGRIGPLWAVLIVSGAALIVLALAVERALRRGPSRERGGFTAEPLFSDERRARTLETVPVVAGLTPAARVTATDEEGFAGRGGSFGGGGASDRF
jgi:MFS family permease